MIALFVLSVAVLGGTASEVIFGGSYKFLQTVQLSDKESRPGGYQIRATAHIEQVHSDLLSVKLTELKLYSQPKNLVPDDFKKRKSLLDTEEHNEFFIELTNGLVHNIYVADSESLVLVNLKKAFSSLLQFQTKSGERNENDISGKCKVKYVLNGSVIQKFKTACETTTSLLKDHVWSGAVDSQRKGEITLFNNRLDSVLYKEDHEIRTNIADFVAVLISTSARLERLDSDVPIPRDSRNEDIQDVVAKTGNKIGKNYIKYDLTLDNNVENKNESDQIGFTEILKENALFLSNKELGTVNSAAAALKVIRAAQKASYNDIFSSLKAKANKKIIEQLLDILGAVQTPESHSAAKEFLKLNTKDYNLDLCERYLWALSTSARHEKAIITDLLELADLEISNKKLLETLVQTIASMVRKYVEHTKDVELLKTTLEFLSKKLKNCPKEDDICERIYLKSFINIGSTEATSLLMDYAVNGRKSSSTCAMRALWKLGQNSWNSDVVETAEKILFSNRTYDSSAKTAALDILLKTGKTSNINKIIQILKKRDAAELKEYFLQRLSQISEKDKDFERSIKSSLVSEGLYNYDALATGGLSTAFDRQFMKNGFLSTTQEVKSGILKQGFVDINIQLNETPQTVFTLGLFSNGLGSFVSDESSDAEDDVTNAGLELTVMGVEFRPFVFFEGQGELMGHVFSGAGSTITPAYQAVLLLEDDKMILRLGTGELLKVGFSSVASVDLSGKIEISLWTRSAESLVQNRAGLIIQEAVEVLSPYITSQAKIELTAEPQLKLSSDIQFSDKVALCLTLEQPQTEVRYNTSVATNIIGSSYRKIMNKRRKIVVPGRTYALNAKNNEMCNSLY